MKRRFNRASIVLVGFLLVAVAGFFVWTRAARYEAFPEARSVAERARTVSGWWVFEPAAAPTAGFIFYPGGLVDAAAYAPFMERLAAGGVLAVIVPMPLDLAVFGIGRAADVIASIPLSAPWVIGGHSLGGSMAAEFVKANPSAADGLVLLASYPAAATDLSGFPIRALSIYGTENGVTPPEGFADSLRLLPPGTPLIEIDGGNHAGFGHYGPQAGDGTASIPREEQQWQTAEAILAFVGDLPR